MDDADKSVDDDNVAAVPAKFSLDEIDAVSGKSPVAEVSGGMFR